MLRRPCLFGRNHDWMLWKYRDVNRMRWYARRTSHFRRQFDRMRRENRQIDWMLGRGRHNHDRMRRRDRIVNRVLWSAYWRQHNRVSGFTTCCRRFLWRQHNRMGWSSRDVNRMGWI